MGHKKYAVLLHFRRVQTVLLKALFFVGLHYIVNYTFYIIKYIQMKIKYHALYVHMRGTEKIK